MIHSFYFAEDMDVSLIILLLGLLKNIHKKIIIHVCIAYLSSTITIRPKNNNIFYCSLIYLSFRQPCMSEYMSLTPEKTCFQLSTHYTDKSNITEYFVISSYRKVFAVALSLHSWSAQDLYCMLMRCPILKLQKSEL